MKFFLMILLFGMAVLFTACSSESGGSSEVVQEDSSEVIEESSSIVMVIDEIYTIDEGQTITKTSELAEVIIETDTSTGVTTAILKSGSANIE